MPPTKSNTCNMVKWQYCHKLTHVHFQTEFLHVVSHQHWGAQNRIYQQFFDIVCLYHFLGPLSAKTAHGYSLSSKCIKICPVTPKLLLGPDKFHNKALHCENLQWLNLWTSKLAKSIVHILLHGKNFSCLTKNIDYSCFFLRCQERGIITSSHFLHLYKIVNTMLS